MGSVQTSIFRTNKTQAVPLPKTVELPETVKKVTIVAVGNTRIITHVGESWDTWFDNYHVSSDFMNSLELSRITDLEGR
ncbi:type II toxin-antitoxin system VapB family antitoxin [Anabaenopsis elenkinii]|uniref:AbrB/MazE/SpoVT family DNA-binding domain-containing protein n=1 Tax=Anabaenopsis elenkinii CCIBt3563 TaxID=2779889 RepID=A0A7S6RE87_9CYAN|nr:type II toxin-antitoxin system VapB family antitoxin [Anabaenopsis elenkinii]QOV21596.1 AbrB/MazE/SpoVT family DNA-binding domain-containing protein [Anabaenopsis elenkinii CCIBt3563]QOV23319.1 AbrB/MazE/SpoVT family DNA-binding domain-containing protein [Anabaenopsis elenkinii CCIBt3563]